MTEQTQRVTGTELRLSVRIAESVPPQNYSVIDRFALDLRDLRAAHAATLAECERLKRELADTNHEFRVTVLAYEDQEKEIAAAEAEAAKLRGELATVLQREADTIARHEAKLDGLEARNEKLRGALEAVAGGSFKGASTLVLGGNWQTVVERIQEIALAALTEDQPHA